MAYSQNWDGVVAPALPAGWTYSALIITATAGIGGDSGLAPYSSPNLLALPLTAAPVVATYDTEDGLSGDVTATLVVALNVAAAAGVSLLGRANATPISYTTSTFIEFILANSPSKVFQINDYASGTSTNIFSVSLSVSLSAETWYLISATLNGTAISNVTVQRTTDGYYLNMSTGVFQAGSSTASATTTITGQGYWGIGSKSAETGEHAYADNFSLTALAASASSAVTEVADTFDGTGAFDAPASSAITENADTFAGSAIGGEPIASSAITEHADTFAGSAIGDLVSPGSGVIAEYHDTLAGYGSRADLVTAVIVEGADTFVASAVPMTGTVIGAGRMAPIVGPPPNGNDQIFAQAVGNTVSTSAAIVGGADAFSGTGGLTTEIIASWASVEAPDGSIGLMDIPPAGYARTFGFLGCSNCCASCEITVCVTDCISGAPIIGASVSISSDPVATCTTISGGCCQLNIGTTGSYQITITAAGYETYRKIGLFQCGITYPIVLRKTGHVSVQFQAVGCGPLVGATCTINGQTCTTDATGVCTIPYVPTGTYPWSIAKTRYQTYTGTVTIPDCANGYTVYLPGDGPAQLQPAPGYAFAIVDGVCCVPDPVPTTLNLTDTATGSCSPVYSAATGKWTGTVAFEWPGYCSMSPAASHATYIWPSTGCGIQVIISNSDCPDGNGAAAGCLGGVFIPGTCGCDYYSCAGFPIVPNHPVESIVLEPEVPLDLTQTMYGCGPPIITTIPGFPCLTVCSGQLYWGDPPQFIGCNVYGAGETPVITLTEP